MASVCLRITGLVELRCQLWNSYFEGGMPGDSTGVKSSSFTVVSWKPTRTNSLR